MKYGLITLLVAFLGIGGMTAEEYAQFGPYQKHQLLYELPWVGHIMKDRVLAKLQLHIEEGDPSAMMILWRFSKQDGDTASMERAILLLEQHDSATSKYYLETMIRKSVPRSSQEGLLLSALSMAENFQPFTYSDTDFKNRIKSNKNAMMRLRQNALDGHADAQWVVAQLNELEEIQK